MGGGIDVWAPWLSADESAKPTGASRTIGNPVGRTGDHCFGNQRLLRLEDLARVCVESVSEDVVCTVFCLFFTILFITTVSIKMES